MSKNTNLSSNGKPLSGSNLPYLIIREGKRLLIEFEVDGEQEGSTRKKYKVPIDPKCPPDFIRQIYEMKVAQIKKEKQNEVSKMPSNND